MSGPDMDPPEYSHYKDPLELLVEQNNILTRNNNMLEMQLYEWKKNAMEAKEKLRRVFSNMNKPNYVDSFYNENYKKIIQGLTEENVKLRKEQLHIPDSSVISEQKETIQLLEDRLEETKRRSEQLERNDQLLESSDNRISELQNEVGILRKRNSRLNIQYSNVKNRLRNQSEITCYVRSEFSKLRKEFIKIFTQYYLVYGEDFINQLKSIDPSDNVPEFLSKPLQQDNSTSTDDLEVTDCIDYPMPEAVVKDIPKDPYKDSGIDTLPEEFCEMMRSAQLRELDEAKSKISQLQEDNKKLSEAEEKLADESKRLKKHIELLEYESLRCQKDLVDARDEITSLTLILKMLQDESNRASVVPDFRNQRGNEVSEPYKANKQLYRPSPSILVRDTGTKKVQSSPSESQDASRYIPRGPVLPVAPTSAVSPSDSSSKIYIEKRKSSESASSSLRLSPEGVPNFMKCDKCNKDIEIEKFGSHSMDCT